MTLRRHSILLCSRRQLACLGKIKPNTTSYVHFSHIWVLTWWETHITDIELCPLWLSFFFLSKRCWIIILNYPIICWSVCPQITFHHVDQSYTNVCSSSRGESCTTSIMNCILPMSGQGVGSQSFLRHSHLMWLFYKTTALHTCYHAPFRCFLLLWSHCWLLWIQAPRATFTLGPVLWAPIVQLLDTALGLCREVPFLRPFI